jgi:hypothetical protein
LSTNVVPINVSPLKLSKKPRLPVVPATGWFGGGGLVVSVCRSSRIGLLLDPMSQIAPRNGLCRWILTGNLNVTPPVRALRPLKKADVAVRSMSVAGVAGPASSIDAVSSFAELWTAAASRL